MYFNQAQKILSKSLHRPSKSNLKVPRIWLLKRNLTSLHLEHLYHLYHHQLNLHHQSTMHPLLLTNNNSPRYTTPVKRILGKMWASSIQHFLHPQRGKNLPPRQPENSFHIVRPLNQKRSPPNRNKQSLRLT